MKRTVIAAILVFLVGLAGAYVGLTLYSRFGAGASLRTGEKPAGGRPSEPGQLRAGMIDPRTGKRILYWRSPMDPTYIRYRPGKSPMGMDLVPVYEEEGGGKEPASVIRIDPATMQNMGVQLAVVKRRPLSRNIRTFGNITYDETKLYSVNTKFSGWIEKLYANFEGQKVREGDALFDIYSPDLVAAQEDYLVALQQHKALGTSPVPGIREGAVRLREAAYTRLKYWDLTPAQLERLETSGEIRKTLTVFSPVTGVVTKMEAVQGHYVKAGEHQYEIADLSTVWVDADIYEYELPWVELGMPAEMDLPYIPDKRFHGKVLYIYPYLKPTTRTATLRLEFRNPGDELKPGMYANVYLKPPVASEALVIPQEAVIETGVRKLVFVSLGGGRFEARQVTTGAEGGGETYQVLQGLHEGETIVVSGQFMLDSESRLREAVREMQEPKKVSPGEPTPSGMTGPGARMPSSDAMGSPGEGKRHD
jgi:multidrug efflux pump subunit AcrA (membrane-fusion protein)